MDKNNLNKTPKLQKRVVQHNTLSLEDIDNGMTTDDNVTTANVDID